MPYTNKEQQKEYNKKYREANKEKIKEYRDDHKEKTKEYDKKYREANKEKIKEYYEQNKQKINEYEKEYYEQNKEKIKENRKTENGKKSARISHWKRRGVISNDYDALYEKYINTNECELCNISITSGKGISGKKHLDHCHMTGEFRNILCGNCNVRVMRNK
jgi:hypothetical protein